MEPAISAIATLTCSGTANPSPAGVSILSFWYFLVTAVPCSKRCLGGRPTPTSRSVRAGDRHLNFYETRDNLLVGSPFVIARAPAARGRPGTACPWNPGHEGGRTAGSSGTDASGTGSAPSAAAAC